MSVYFGLTVFPHNKHSHFQCRLPPGKSTKGFRFACIITSTAFAGTIFLFPQTAQPDPVLMLFSEGLTSSPHVEHKLRHGLPLPLYGSSGVRLRESMNAIASSSSPSCF
jgi:hypothetical protein